MTGMSHLLGPILTLLQLSFHSILHRRLQCIHMVKSYNFCYKFDPHGFVLLLTSFIRMGSTPRASKIGLLSDDVVTGPGRTVATLSRAPKGASHSHFSPSSRHGYSICAYRSIRTRARGRSRPFTACFYSISSPDPGSTTFRAYICFFCQALSFLRDLFASFPSWRSRRPLISSKSIAMARLTLVAAALLSLLSAVIATFNPASSTNVAVYWVSGEVKKWSAVVPS